MKLETFRDAATIERLIKDAETIATKSYQRALGVGFSDTSEIVQRLRFEAEKGWLRGYFLYLDNQPCSFWIASLYEGVLYSNYLGYDPAFAKYSPGMFLMMNVIDSIYGGNQTERVAEIDFGIGDADYKRRFSNHSWQEASISIFAPGLKGLFLDYFSFAFMTANSAAIAILSRSGLLSQVKRWWRRRLARETVDGRQHQ